MSLFSGSEIQAFCGAALFDTLRVGTTYNVKCCAEIDPRKRKFIIDIVRPPPQCCVFGDVQTLAAPCAECHLHERMCDVPEAPVAVGGWSCKDMSPMNNHRLPHCLRDGSGSSGKSFRSLLSFLGSNKSIHVFIGENVDELLDAASDNRAAVLEACNTHGPWLSR